MRGKVSKHKSRAKAMGITPAYAGKRKYKKHTNDHAKDHPRLCGEKSLRSAGRTSQAGSPPPMRGKDEMNLGGADNGRITPAYAGKRMELERM